MSGVLFNTAKHTSSVPSFDNTGTPIISTIPVTILDEKNEVSSLRKISGFQDLDSNTQSLFVTKANITAQSQLRQFAVNTLASFEAK